MSDALAGDTTTPATAAAGGRFWGYLVQHDKQPTPIFEQLLLSIFRHIDRDVIQSQENGLTPSKLAAFYRLVDGDYDNLFLKTPHESLSFIYQSIGCFHTLQPSANPYAPPTIPALTSHGFVRWQTFQLLLEPQVHVPFLQKAVARLELRNEATGQLFPRTLPQNSLPSTADPAMTAWYNRMSDRLLTEAEHAHRKHHHQDSGHVKFPEHGSRSTSHHTANLYHPQNVIHKEGPNASSPSCVAASSFRQCPSRQQALDRLAQLSIKSQGAAKYRPRSGQSSSMFYPGSGHSHSSSRSLESSSASSTSSSAGRSISDTSEQASTNGHGRQHASRTSKADWGPKNKEDLSVSRQTSNREDLSSSAIYASKSHPNIHSLRAAVNARSEHRGERCAGRQSTVLTRGNSSACLSPLNQRRTVPETRHVSKVDRISRIPSESLFRDSAHALHASSRNKSSLGLMTNSTLEGRTDNKLMRSQSQIARPLQGKYAGREAEDRGRLKYTAYGKAVRS